MNSQPTESSRGPSRPTHEEIASRAEVLWRARGCPSGQDEEIWLAAEAQLADEAREIVQPESVQREQMSKPAEETAPTDNPAKAPPRSARKPTRRQNS